MRYYKKGYWKSRSAKNGRPKRMVIEGLETFDQDVIENGFSKFFTGIGQKIASSIPDSSIVFKDFINATNIL